MATKGIVVFGVVAGFIFLIIFIVLLATSAGRRGPPGSAGNWTPEQVEEQARLFGATFSTSAQFSKFGFTAAFFDRVSKCFMEAVSKVQSYEDMKACSAGDTCAPTAGDMRSLLTCMGGDRGNWSTEIKKILVDSAQSDAEMDPALRAAFSCFVEYLESKYDFYGAVAALGTIQGANPTGPVADAATMAALAGCKNKQGAPGG
jgi:hypothetical protein